MTNYHVIKGAQAAKVAITPSGGAPSAEATTYNARLIGYNPDKDVAVLQIDEAAAALKPIAERYGIPKFTLMPLMIKVREELLSLRVRFFSLTPHRSHSLTHS